jgi:hypothetical protein
MKYGCSEFTNLSCFGNLDKNQTRRARLSAPVFRPPHSDRTPGVQTVATTVLPSPLVLGTALPSPPVSAVYKAREWPNEETLSHFAPSQFYILALFSPLLLCTAAVLPSPVTVRTGPSSPSSAITPRWLSTYQRVSMILLDF